MFKIQGLTIVDVAETTREENAEEGSAASLTDPSKPKPVFQQRESDFMRVAEGEVEITQRHLNYMPGSLHGGAIAISAEEIARRCPPWWSEDVSAEPFRNPRVRYMEVHYMSPIKKRVGLAAVSSGTSSQVTENKVTRVAISEVGGSKRGTLCAEALLLWGEGLHKEESRGT